MLVSYQKHSDLNVHAKLLTKKFSIPLSHSKEILAYRFGFEKWTELYAAWKPYPAKLLGDNELSRICPKEYQEFQQWIEQYIPQILQESPPCLAFEESLIYKIVNRQWLTIEPTQIHSFFDDEDYSLKDLNNHNDFSDISVKELINVLNFGDNSLSKYFKSPKRLSNGTMESDFNLQRFYCYKYRKGNKVYIQSREWDFEVFQPFLQRWFFRGERENLQYFLSSANRPWFINYQINYLKSLSAELNKQGYESTFRLQNFNNVNLYDLVQYGSDAKRFHSGLQKFTRELIRLDGRLTQKKGTDGHDHYDRGIEIAFHNPIFSMESVR